MAIKKPLGLYLGDVEGFATGDFIDILFGGTGGSTKLAAFNNLSPLTVKGDIVGSNGVDNIKLPIGLNGLVLTADSTQAIGFRWAAAPVTTVAGRAGAVVLSNTDIGGLGTMATQNASAISVTGGTLANVTMSATPALNDNSFKIATTEFVQINQKVSSVAGRTGAVVLSNTDISGLGTMSAQNSTSVSITGGNISNATLTAAVLNTSPLFNNDSLSVASTNFVHANQSRFVKASGVGITVNTTLTNADCGKWLQIQASITVTLPDINTVLIDGKTFTFMSAAPFTLTCFTGQSIIGLLNTQSSSLTIPFGYSMTIVKNGNAWYVTEFSSDNSLKAGSGNNTDITGLNSLVSSKLNASVQNTTPNNLNTFCSISVTDNSTIARVSSQSLRLDYTRDVNATGAPTAFDSLINTSISINNSLSTGVVYSANLEGPIVATGKTLANYVALRIGAPSGAGGVTNKIAMIVQTGAGPVLIGRETDIDGFSKLQINGQLLIDNGQLVNITPNAGIEVGSTTVGNTPYVDFHSSGSLSDYDSRIIASGGNTTSGNGVLTYLAALNKFDGRVIITTTGASDSLSVVDTGANGASVKFTGNGTATPSKYIRVTDGKFQVVNNAYNAVIFSITDTGAIVSNDTISASGIISGASFSGAGTGLTGNALSLNAGAARQLEGDEKNWGSLRLRSVANMIGWMNYGNSHVIFDASNSLSPSGVSVNNTNSGVVWTSTYPTLMGWNGSSTYGVRVDSSRVSDSCSGNANSATNASNTSSFLAPGGSYIASSSSGATNFGQSIQIREPGLVGSSMGTTMAFSPRLAWHWSAVVASSIAIETSGRMGIYNNPGTGYEDFIAKEIYASGNITAFSDERLKTNWRSLPDNFIENLSNLKHGIYDRIDLQGQTQVGISAQSLQAFMPQAVMQEDDEMKTLSVVYGNAAMVSCVQLAKEIMNMQSRICQLEKRS